MNNEDQWNALHRAFAVTMLLALAVFGVSVSFLHTRPVSLHAFHREQHSRQKRDRGSVFALDSRDDQTNPSDATLRPDDDSSLSAAVLFEAPALPVPYETDLAGHSCWVSLPQQPGFHLWPLPRPPSLGVIA